MFLLTTLLLSVSIPEVPDKPRTNHLYVLSLNLVPGEFDTNHPVFVGQGARVYYEPYEHNTLRLYGVTCEWDGITYSFNIGDALIFIMLRSEEDFRMFMETLTRWEYLQVLEYLGITTLSVDL